MRREISTNVYDDAYINKNNKVVFAGAEWECDVTKLLKNSHLDEEGYLIGEDNKNMI